MLVQLGWTALRVRVRRCSWVAVNPERVDKHGKSPLSDHDGIEFVPVVVLTTSGNEDGPKQGRKSLWAKPRLKIVGTGKYGVALDAGPLPATPKRHGDLGSGPEV